MKDPIVKNGLLLAATWIGLYLIIYLIKPSLLFSFGVSTAISLLVPIFFMRKGVLEKREENEGMISFGEAFVPGIAIFFIGSLLYFGVQAVHIAKDTNFRELGEKISYDVGKSAMTKTFNLLNIPEEDRAEAYAEFDKNPPKLSPIQILLGLLVSLVFPGSIIALIVAAVLKRT